MLSWKLILVPEIQDLQIKTLGTLKMKLEDFGYNETLEEFRIGHNIGKAETGRIIAEHKERYIVKTTEGETEAEITGNMRFCAKSREDFPAVGDWVGITAYDPGLAIIHTIFPRSSVLKRQAVNQYGEIQLIAVNVDFAFIVQALDRDYSINRIERYLTICNASNIKPVIVLTKTDLLEAEKVTVCINQIKERIKDISVIAVSNLTHAGYDVVNGLFEKGKTYCLLGSSGVGKSTLLNNLSSMEVMKTGEIGHGTNRGKHVTSHRELFLLDNGGILIDNPGLREVGIADTSGGLETTFSGISELAEKCRFKNCTHTGETGCAVTNALNNGELDEESYQNYIKMLKERAHFETTVSERRKKDKIFGKILKDYNKNFRDQ